MTIEELRELVNAADKAIGTLLGMPHPQTWLRHSPVLFQPFGSAFSLALAAEWEKRFASNRNAWIWSRLFECDEPNRKQLLKQLGVDKRFTGQEVLVDLSVFETKTHPDRDVCPVLAMESEMANQGNVADDSWGYAWDFWKALWVQSPTRLFTCRVGAMGRTSGTSRRKTLAETLIRMITQTYPSFLGPKDEVGIVILADEWHARADSLLIVRDQGEVSQPQKLGPVPS